MPSWLITSPLLWLSHRNPMQVPTIPNFRLTHGSVRGFFDSQKADVVCFQAWIKSCTIFPILLRVKLRGRGGDDHEEHDMRLSRRRPNC